MQTLVVLNPRTMAQAEALGLDIITPCATTAATLHEDLTALRNDSKLMAKTNDILERNCGLTLTGEVNVHHLLHVIVDEIGIEELEIGQEPLRLQDCWILWPQYATEGACGGDDVFDPDYLEQVIAALGGQPVDWTSRTQSVGVPGIFSRRKNGPQANRRCSFRCQIRRCRVGGQRLQSIAHVDGCLSRQSGQGIRGINQNPHHSPY